MALTARFIVARSRSDKISRISENVYLKASINYAFNDSTLALLGEGFRFAAIDIGDTYSFSREPYNSENNSIRTVSDLSLIDQPLAEPISMITFCFSAICRNGRDKEIKAVARQRDKESGSVRAVGRFCARRGIHTVRFGSTDYAHSSLTEGTSINVAQEHGAICLGRETNRCSIAEYTAGLTADARGRIIP